MMEHLLLGYLEGFIYYIYTPIYECVYLSTQTHCLKAMLDRQNVMYIFWVNIYIYIYVYLYIYTK